MYGEYDNIESDNDKGIATAEYGYAKNKRFDLKQFMLLLGTTGKEGIPLYMEALSGNSSDQKSIINGALKMQELYKSFNTGNEMIYVADSAYYSGAVENSASLTWLTRVPETNLKSKELISLTNVPWVEINYNYSMFVQEVEYKSVKQRWALIFSKEAYNKEIKTVDNKVKSENVELEKKIRLIQKEEYRDIKDVQKLISRINKKLKFHEITYSIRKEIIKVKKQEEITYKIICEVKTNEQEINRIKDTKGRFIVATNQLDKDKLKDIEMLPNYKEQSGTESGFKFIKDKTFEVDAIYLKKESRINALLMVMTLCLLVFSYSQFKIRNALKNQKKKIGAQNKSKTDNPTIKWIYQLFSRICVLTSNINRNKITLILNLNDELKEIVRLFGKAACKIYEVR